MQVYQQGSWIGGLPDATRSADEYRVEVQGLRNLEALRSVYFVRRKSLRTVWNHLGEVGPVTVARKVLSRCREKGRNEKYSSAGWGRILAAPQGSKFAVGDKVVFLLPIAPACGSRIVVPEVLLRACDPSLAELAEEQTILYCADTPELEPEARWWSPLRAWSPWSGERISPVDAELALKEASELLRSTPWSSALRLVCNGDAVSETVPAQPEIRPRPSAPSGARKSAVLVGFGNYAKTIVLPQIRKHLDVTRIHEIDPTQMQPGRYGDVVWDTAPNLRPGERTDAVLVAGYHHTHADVAVRALRAGAAAVIEKPVATTRSQLRQLTSAMSETEGRVFSCFQRRYLAFNDMARADLGVAAGDPISYHAVVYEVPLPQHHWYRWANSNSRLVSNGCHWIDHFLYLNGYCNVEAYDLVAAPDGTLNCSVTLENGAFCTMVLTDRGSARIGVQDHVELRAGAATVRMVDASRYVSENRHRILRRKRTSRVDGYKRMYGSIARRIADGLPGDSMLEVERPTELMLALEERLNQVVGQSDIEVPHFARHSDVLRAIDLDRVA